VGYGTRPMVKWDWWNGPAGPLPERRQLSSGTAIIGDIVSSPTNLDYGHVTGVNMNYADGSVVWLDREQLEPTLSQLQSGFDWSLDDLVLNEDDPQSLWMLLNR
jgi:prepilin-type processing-associated H-X9-DG protein